MVHVHLNLYILTPISLICLLICTFYWSRAPRGAKQPIFACLCKSTATLGITTCAITFERRICLQAAIWPFTIGSYPVGRALYASALYAAAMGVLASSSPRRYTPSRYDDGSHLVAVSRCDGGSGSNLEYITCVQDACAGNSGARARISRPYPTETDAGSVTEESAAIGEALGVTTC